MILITPTTIIIIVIIIIKPNSNLLHDQKTENFGLEIRHCSVSKCMVPFGLGKTQSVERD